MIKTIGWIGLALSVLGFVSPATVRADDWNKKTVLTFRQTFEVPGHILPAGTYTFKLADTLSDRHIVQIFNAVGTRLIATVITIPDYRLETTTETVITFNEVPRGSPDTIRAWFHPGNSVGQEFVYPKPRAASLAEAAKIAVPAIDVAEAADVNALKTARIVAILPDQRETPVSAAIQTAPVPNLAAPVPNLAEANASQQGEGSTVVQPSRQNAWTTLPQTASAVLLMVSLGCVSIGVAGLLLLLRRRNPAPRPIAARPADMSRSSDGRSGHRASPY
jgi:LPXTG-motif cell wall-anchored protein